MVKFLTTAGISAELEKLVRGAQKEITLISPYIKVNQRLLGDIKDVNQRGVQFTIIYGKRDMRSEEKEWIDNLAPAEIGFVENLHAKCYLNESTAIITSMNLYEFSQRNNDEMGIQVDSKEDCQLYQEIKAEAERLMRIATNRQSRLPEPPPEPVRRQSRPPVATPEPAQRIRTNGYCIRCHASISLDPGKPLCYQCYQNWVRYENEDYPEEYCHRCGKENKTSMAKPLCYPCYLSSRDETDELPF